MMMKNLNRIVLFMGCLWFMGCTCIKKESEGKQLLRENWKIQQASKVNADGGQIASPSFATTDWFDAKVPSTVMGILSIQPEYAQLFMGDNYDRADKSKFDESWWYRTEFNLKPSKEQHVLLQFDGISYRANIWLNGKQVASKDSVEGSFRRFEFDVTSLIQCGNNVLAVEVFRQQKGDFGLGFVDWNPRPLDENLGLWRDVTVSVVNAVQLKNAFVRSHVNVQTLDEAWLTVGAELNNFTSKPVTGTLKVVIEGVEVSQQIQLNANERKEVTLTAEQFEQLHLKNPRLWWCSGLGEPNLYTGDLIFEVNGTIQASDKITFGIREIETYFTTQGDKGFRLNGKEVLIQGAGWTDDIFLRDTHQSNETQVQYVKDMGMNTIRFETVWGNDQNIFDLCDRYGILAMVGWSCQWEWENYLGKACDDFGGATTNEDFDLMTDYLHDQIIWLRNHPSIFVWLLGSDMLPRPELEKRYIDIFNKLDNRPWLGAASNRISELTGPTGVKMNGPYEYVGPSYWYVDKKYGGAFGFNTETGPGPQLPVKESIEKMIPANQLWPLSEAWDKHCTVSSTDMNSMKLLNQIVTQTWGEAQGYDDFVMKGHLVNYEALRAMFEAFRVNRPASTGIIQWMLNSAWPSLYWQVYDYYLVPTPAYYAVKKALSPVQLIYHYGNRSVMISNDQRKAIDGAKARITAYSAQSKLLWTREIPVSVGANSSEKLIELAPWNETVLLNMELIDASGAAIADNVYWLSAKDEVYDWNATNWVYTPMKAYADYRAFNQLQPSQLTVNIENKNVNDETIIQVTLENKTTSIALFNQLKLHDGNGSWIVPAFYSDNYFSVMPNQSKVISIQLKTKQAEGSLQLELSGWKTEVQNIKIK